MRRPLDLSIRSTSSLTCAGVEPEVGQLVAPAAGDEDPARVVDPDLLDRRVVEEGLQRPEAGDAGDQLADHRAVVGDRRDRAGEAEVVVVADDVLGDAAYDERLALRVDALAADALAHLPVEPLDEVVVRAASTRPSIARRSMPCVPASPRGQVPEARLPAQDA